MNISRLLLLLIILTGCSSQTSTGEIAHDLQTVKSWVATAHMVGEAWIRGAVPTPYTKQTLQTAQRELHKEADTLAKKPSMQQQTILNEHLKKIQQIMSQMSTAVEQKDRTTVAQQIQQLSTEEQAIATLAKSAGERR